MDSVVIGLVLLAIYGLALIAYQRPMGYQRVVWPLMALSVAASAGVSIWNMSSDQTELALSPHVADYKLAEAAAAAAGVKVSSEVGLLVVVVLPIYLMVLLGLPFLVTALGARKRNKIDA
jgi:predicted MFS family arabinose efflux permease